MRRRRARVLAQALDPYRRLLRIESPGMLDGGDVLVAGKTVWIGIGSRSNMEAVRQVRRFLSPYGYMVFTVPVRGCLHLKSAVTQAGGRTLLVNPEWVAKSAFPGFGFIDIDPQEPTAANILMVGEQVVYQPAFPRTLERLQAAGIQPLLVDASELGKAEGALTCCSLLFNSP